MSTPHPRPLRCHVPFLSGRMDVCRHTLLASDHREEMYLGKRGGTDPYGQVLPDWLTWADYTTTVEGQVVTTGSVAQLPLTYYGPSIPLGPDWVYGGLTSPPVTATTALATTATDGEAAPASTDSDLPLMITEGTESLGTSTAVSSPIPSSTSAVSASTLSSPSPTTVAPSPSTTSAFTTSAPASTVTSSTSASASLPANSTIDLTTSVAATSNSAAPSPSSSDNPSSGSTLLPLLPALLVPLVFLLVTVLIILWYLFLPRRNGPPVTGPTGPSKLPAWLAAIIHPSRRGYQRSNSPSTPPPATLPLPDPRSPNEKSALLPGFTPHHHRNSSSIATPPDEEMEELASQSQSLLQRLSLGLGWLTPTSSREPRKPSGFTLERGLRSASYTAVPTSTKRDSAGTVESSGKGNESSGIQSSGAPRSMTDEQLFYRPPVPTVSSKRTSAGSSLSRGIGPSRRSWFSRISQTGRSEGSAMRRSDEADGISVAVPSTPGTAGTGDLGEFGKASIWKEGGERLRFPIPPNSPVPPRNSSQGTFGERGVNTESKSSSESGSSHFYSADSSPYATPVIPPTGQVPAPSGVPITRTDQAYKHASLSVFGSHPSTPVHSVRHPKSSPGHENENESPISPASTARVESPGARSTTSDALRPMAHLFALTPPTSPGSTGHDRSFPGEPIVDMGRLTAGQGATRHVSVGEFGESLHPGPDGSRTITSTASAVGHDQFSEAASIYSGPSRATSRGGSGTGTGSSASHSHVSREGTVVSDRALRGRRSQPQLLRASMLAVPERPLPLLPPLTPEIARTETPKGRKSWFGKGKE